MRRRTGAPNPPLRAYARAILGSFWPGDRAFRRDVAALDDFLDRMSAAGWPVPEDLVLRGPEGRVAYTTAEANTARSVRAARAAGAKASWNEIRPLSISCADEDELLGRAAARLPHLTEHELVVAITHGRLLRPEQRPSDSNATPVSASSGR